MKRKEILRGFYRTIGTGLALLVGMILLLIVAIITGASIDFAGIQIN